MRLSSLTKCKTANTVTKTEMLSMANDREWDRRSSSWVEAQNKSNKLKAEADKLDKHGKERRKYMAERRT